MKYYIVALFDDSSYEFIAPVQRTVSRKLKANRNSPAPYIALEVVDNPNIEKLTSIIEKILNPYKRFKIELSSEISISEDLKTVNLGISYRGYIKKIERSLKDTLKLHGFNVRENNSNNLSISLANLNYISKDSKRKVIDTQIIPQNKIENKTLKINRFQLWKVPGNKKESKIKDFELKAF